MQNNSMLASLKAILLMVLMMCSVSVMAQTITTDQPDYAPGSTATFTGSGFTVGETVSLVVHHADGTPDSGADHDPWMVTADANGDFVTTWHVCEDDCLGSTLRVTADGISSGMHAFALFTDAGPSGQINISTTAAVVENFNTTTTTALPTAWSIQQSAAPNWGIGSNATSFVASSGSPVTGGTYTWGNTALTDFSVGAMTSSGFASPNSLMAKYVNGNLGAINKLTISFNAKKYRTNTAAASVQFFYSLDGSTWISITAGDIAAATIGTGTSAYLFGTPTVYSVAAFSITGLNIPNGSNIYLRWNINTTGSNSQGIGIDDVNVTAAFNTIAGSNIVNGGVNFVGRINGYSQPVNCSVGDYRVLNYRKVSTTTANTTDGRGQWFTTVNVQSSGGNVTPDNMPGGGGAGFLLTSGGGCGVTENFTDKCNGRQYPYLYPYL